VKLQSKPLRTCLSMHECCVCKEKIKYGESYYDGGIRKRAHERCMINPIELNATQESLVKLWASDDRLWTTQETVEFNLRVFARNIIKWDTEERKPSPLGAASSVMLLSVETIMAMLLT
jgi:recombinational DNA repair protein (RecF pathway)